MKHKKAFVFDETAKMILLIALLLVILIIIVVKFQPNLMGSLSFLDLW